jgi:hypothetical protein
MIVQADHILYPINWIVTVKISPYFYPISIFAYNPYL